MKKLLLLLSRFPYPPIGGDKLKAYNLIKLLSRDFEIHLVSILHRKITQEDIDFCETYCKKYKFFYKTKLNSMFAILKNIFTQKPIQACYYYFKDVQEYIDKEIQECDLIINVLIRTSEYVINYDKPKFLDMVDSIALNYQRSKNKTKSLFWKLIYTYEAPKLFEYEKKCLRAYDYTFFVNKEECDYWSRFGKAAWIPIGVKDELFNYNKKNEKYKNYIAFFGKMDYQPNIDAVIWFMKNVFEKLDKNIKFVIAGSNPPKKIKKYASERVEITRFLEDPYEILNSCFVCVAPMQTGGVFRIKS